MRDVLLNFNKSFKNINYKNNINEYYNLCDKSYLITQLINHIYFFIILIYLFTHISFYYQINI